MSVKKVFILSIILVFPFIPTFGHLEFARNEIELDSQG